MQSSQGAVVQLVRMPACHAGGRGFESLPHRRKPHKSVEVQQLARLFSIIAQDRIGSYRILHETET